MSFMNTSLLDLLNGQTVMSFVNVIIATRRWAKGFRVVPTDDGRIVEKFPEELASFLLRFVGAFPFQFFGIFGIVTVFVLLVEGVFSLFGREYSLTISSVISKSKFAVSKIEMDSPLLLLLLGIDL